MWAKRGNGNKYGNQKTVIDGHEFGSKLEAALYHRLLIRQRCGAIRDLKPHPGTVFLSKARIQYRPDFSFLDALSGEKMWAESKSGYPDQKWPLKKKLWAFYGPGKLEIWVGTAANLVFKEIVESVKESD